MRQLDDDALAADTPLASTDRALAEQLADDLEAMGPTYVKLGQVLSSRPDLIPPAFSEALARLQDRVKPFSDAEAQQIIETELGARISKAFSRFDPEPIAAASLGQVHRAALRHGRADHPWHAGEAAARGERGQGRAGDRRRPADQ